jgi:hypothetical protein
MIVDHLASPAVAGFSVSKIKGQGPSMNGLLTPTGQRAVPAVDRLDQPFAWSLGEIQAHATELALPKRADPSSTTPLESRLPVRHHLRRFVGPVSGHRRWADAAVGHDRSP